MSETFHRVSTSLQIHVRSAVGSGPTALAAFDGALAGAGVSNFNLVRLSSVIPPGALVTRGVRDSSVGDGADGLVIDLRESVPGDAPRTRWGDRLFAVWAQQSAEVLGQEAWAGVAWVQHPDDGRGLFVEHEGHSESQVRRELTATLTSIADRRGLAEFEQYSVVAGTRCEGEPVTALVIAPFGSEGWAPQTARVTS